MAGFRFVIADVFTDVPFAGNQLAVFTDAREIPEEQQQRLAIRGAGRGVEVGKTIRFPKKMYWCPCALLPCY